MTDEFFFKHLNVNLVEDDRKLPPEVDDSNFSVHDYRKSQPEVDD